MLIVLHHRIACAAYSLMRHVSTTFRSRAGCGQRRSLDVSASHGVSVLSVAYCSMCSSPHRCRPNQAEMRLGEDAAWGGRGLGRMRAWPGLQGLRESGEDRCTWPDATHTIALVPMARRDHSTESLDRPEGGTPLPRHARRYCYIGDRMFQRRPSRDAAHRRRSPRAGRAWA